MRSMTAHGEKESTGPHIRFLEDAYFFRFKKGAILPLLNRAQGSPFWVVIGTHGKNHNRSIYQKLEIASRDELIDDTPGDIT